MADAQRQEAARRQRELEQEKAQVQSQIEALQHKAGRPGGGPRFTRRYEQARLEAATRDHAELASAREAD